MATVKFKNHYNFDQYDKRNYDYNQGDSIVEGSCLKIRDLINRSYRGNIKDQFGNAVWLKESNHNSLDVEKFKNLDIVKQEIIAKQIEYQFDKQMQEVKLKTELLKQENEAKLLAKLKGEIDSSNEA